MLEDREITLKTLGHMTVSAIERDFLVGDYGVVQSYLSIEKMPSFINSIRVVDAQGNRQTSISGIIKINVVGKRVQSSR